MKIIEHPQFDLKEFSNRWQRARFSSLMSVFAQSEANQYLSPSEGALLKLIPPEAQDLALRKVFDCSRKLGLSAARHLGISLEISDFAEILPHMSLPCFRGKWRVHNSAQVLERDGCDSLEALGSFGCDYWREALDGLVMGFGDNERLARHRSRGHGDKECTDVLFTEEYTMPKVINADGTSVSRPPLKLGPVPPEVTATLKATKERFGAMKVHFTLEGLSEGKLYYRLDAEEGVLCGAGGKLLHDSFVAELANLCPSLVAFDSSPIAVYGGST